MFYSILKQWKTLNGEYHSSTVDKADYDTAFGSFHSMFLPMQNDTNVASFVITVLDENGERVKRDKWFRKILPAEEVEESEDN